MGLVWSKGHLIVTWHLFWWNDNTIGESQISDIHNRFTNVVYINSPSLNSSHIAFLFWKNWKKKLYWRKSLVKLHKAFVIFNKDMPKWRFSIATILKFHCMHLINKKCSKLSALNTEWWLDWGDRDNLYDTFRMENVLQLLSNRKIIFKKISELPRILHTKIIIDDLKTSSFWKSFKNINYFY